MQEDLNHNEKKLQIKKKAYSEEVIKHCDITNVK